MSVYLTFLIWHCFVIDAKITAQITGESVICSKHIWIGQDARFEQAQSSPSRSILSPLLSTNTFISRNAIAWTSDATLWGSWISPETCLETGVCSRLWLQSCHIEIRCKTLLRTWEQCSVWAASSCHCTFIKLISLCPMESLDLAAGTCLYPCG